MKKGDIIRAGIDRLMPDGAGRGDVEGRTVAVRGAVPGDVVDVRVLGVKRKTVRGRLEAVVEDSAGRIPAACPHFDVCGGCIWQDVPYERQCSLKAGLVNDALRSVPGMPPPDDVRVEPSADTFFYRNKMEFSFDRPPSQDEVNLGLHAAGRFDRVFDVERCLLQSPDSNRAVAAMREFMVGHGLDAYGLRSHRGLLRYLVVRDGKNTGDLMVNLVTSGEDFPQESGFVGHILGTMPGTTTVLHTINRSPSSVATGDERRMLHGGGVITDRIGGCTFTVSPDAFFQTNTHQAERLYSCIREFCSLDGGQRLLDLYCGAGTIGIFCADGARSVTGIEIVGDAVRDARINAENNDAGNCTFIEGPVEKLLDEDMRGRYDVVICDPPRPGIHPRAMEVLGMLRIPRMVYVSCNVKVLPQDLEVLALAGYRPVAIRAFDMSPHTPHIETVVSLEIS